MALRKETNDIKGYNPNRRTFLTTKKGYYLLGFTTHINRATKKDREMVETYAINLVSSFEKVDSDLIMLIKVDATNTLSTIIYTYEVRVGIMHLGNIRILIQTLPKSYHIQFVYEYRVGIGEFRKANSYSGTHYKSTGAKLTRQKSRSSRNNKKKRK